MILIGAGLILLGLAAFFVLPKPAADKQVEDKSADPPSAVPMVVDLPAPELRLTDLQGSPVALDDYRGQWCC